MTRYAAILAYDGTAYQGFQRQPAPAPTIQRAVEDALEAATGQPTAILAAGRTDSGVHASGQVIAFDAAWRHEAVDLMRAVNARLPQDIALQGLWRQDGFHPRFDALWRGYAYRIATPPARNPLLRHSAWQLIGESLDLDRLNAAASLCLGAHDFAAFGTPPQEGSSNTWREVFESRWQRVAGDYGAVYVYRVRATAFLYHMVRRMAGMMAQVGRGKLSPDAFEDILRSRDITRAKVLAPAHGLTLEAVGYAPRETEFALDAALTEAAVELERG